MRIQSLHIYPVKSCGVINLDHAELDPRGFKHDRQWMIMSAQHGFMTQRQEPKLATIQPALTSSKLILNAPGMAGMALPLLRQSAETRQNVKVWNDTTEAADQGDEVAEWLNRYLGHSDLRLVRQCDDAERPFAVKNGAPAGQIAFMDSRPLLVISEASLTDLNTRLLTPWPMNRFRPNIVVEDCAAYEEDRISCATVGEVTLHHAKLCARCVITSIDQTSGQSQGKEPLKTLAQYRKTEGGVAFGCYFVHSGAGPLSVGDEWQPGSNGI